MSTPQPAADEWLIPTVVLRVATVVASLLVLLQVAVWGTICIMTLDLKYAWWVWSAGVAVAIVGMLWLYNLIIARVVPDEQA